VNDDGTSLSISDASVTEGNSSTSTATFTVTLSAPSSGTVTVHYATANGSTNPATGGASCSAGVDYISRPNTVLTFNPGETIKPITVQACGDTVVEQNDTFFVILANPSGSPIAASQGLCPTVNDDGASLSIGDASVSEGNSGTTTATFLVTLSATSALPVT